MKNALLVIDHGSKKTEANQMLEALLIELKAKRPDLIIKIAHMELADPDIEAGINACISEGATHITIQPFMLSMGRHVTEDVPHLVKEALKGHKDVTFTISGSLGPDPLLTELVLKKAGI